MPSTPHFHPTFQIALHANQKLKLSNLLVIEGGVGAKDGRYDLTVLFFPIYTLFCQSKLPCMQRGDDAIRIISVCVP